MHVKNTDSKIRKIRHNHCSKQLKSCQPRGMSRNNRLFSSTSSSFRRRGQSLASSRPPSPSPSVDTSPSPSVAWAFTPMSMESISPGKNAARHQLLINFSWCIFFPHLSFLCFLCFLNLLKTFHPLYRMHCIDGYAGCFLVLDLDPEKLNRTWRLGCGFSPFLWLFVLLGYPLLTRFVPY